MKAEIEGSDHYFKGPAVPEAPGASGEAVLTVGVSAAGDPLQEVDTAEFNRGFRTEAKTFKPSSPG